MEKKSFVKCGRVPSYAWEVGKAYYVECGIWKGRVEYVGAFPIGKRIKHIFTFGDSANWKNQFNLIDTKSHFKVYEFLCEPVALLDNGDITNSNE